MDLFCVLSQPLFVNLFVLDITKPSSQLQQSFSISLLSQASTLFAVDSVELLQAKIRVKPHPVRINSSINSVLSQEVEYPLNNINRQVYCVMSDSSSNTEKVQDGIAVKETRKKTVCQFYARGQWCRFGSRCRFLHQRQPKPKASKSKPARNSTTEQQHEGLNEIENLNLVPEEEPLGANLAPGPSTEDNRKLICKFFVKHRFCGYGDNCRFSHEVPVKKNTNVADPPQETPVEVRNHTGHDGNNENRTRPYRNAAGRRPRKPLCRYFKRGGCALGDRCKFYHPVKNILDDVTDDLKNVKLSDELEDGAGGAAASPASDGAAKPKVRGYQHRRTPIYNRSGGPQFQFRLDDLKTEDLENLRQREISQLKRRYPQAEAFEDEKGRDAFTITFVPTDPDWPYDVKHLKMTIIFAEDYPAKRLQVKLPEDEAVPDTVKRQVWFGMQDWLRSRFDRLAENGMVELVFKSLLRLLDRSLEDLFTEGLKLYKKELMAKASGIELVSASVLNDKYNQSSDEEDEEEEEDEKDEDGDYFDEDEYDSGTEDGESEGDEEAEEDAEYNVDHRTLDPAKRGIEVKLQQLQLKESASTLRIYFAKFVLQCGRCKNNSEVKLATSSPTVIICNKCHEEQIVQLRPGITHQFTSVIGYLDAENCSPVDLILTDCLFMIGCMECSKESKVEGLPHGQLKTIFCSCHKKLQLAVESTRFTQLRASDYVDIRGAVVVKAKKKSARDPAIQEGKPLPNTGTCKHYKKSFRWLRFPCCGKAYPCDECHDEKEDHEMQFANRMICGFCAKEQTFAANRDCIMCGSNMTKKTGSHWEGGKGCRDVVKMSRGDKKKYANSNKTVSKKSQVKPKSGKKTKLRHV